VAAARRHRDAAGGLGVGLRRASACSSTATASASATAGQEIVDQHFFILFNAGDDDVQFTIPRRSSARMGGARRHRGERTDEAPLRGGDTVDVPAIAHGAVSAGPPPEVDHSVAASLAALTTPIDIVPAPAPQPSPHSP
jgi:glycogen operon protein